jgi:3-oxoadipate enol-lactonase
VVLCKQFHAIRYDRRGYGRSPATTKPYYEADDVAALLLDRKVSQSALVASSHGGNIVLSFALRYPAHVIGLVLIGPETEGFPYSEHFVMAQMVSRCEGSDQNPSSEYLLYCGRQ